MDFISTEIPRTVFVEPDVPPVTTDSICENLTELIERAAMLATQANGIADAVVGVSSRNCLQGSEKEREQPRDIASMVVVLARTIGCIESAFNRF